MDSRRILFQSTPPARGATTNSALSHRAAAYFNPRPPRGGRRLSLSVGMHHADFNPRPPRGGRPYFLWRTGKRWKFQSTPPARGATCANGHLQICQVYFNPRPPRGGRQRRDAAGPDVVHFNPRPPRGGRQDGRGAPEDLRNFNPRPPRGGRPSTYTLGQTADYIFQSTPPARGATAAGDTFVEPTVFQSTPPARGATLPVFSVLCKSIISIHAPREGGDCNTAKTTFWGW